MEPSPRPSATLIVQLLDRTRGIPVQSWHITQPLARIGRARECEIAIGDPYVSRQHAELRFGEGTWLLVCLSQRGLLVGGVPVMIARVTDPMEFKLGPAGPELKVISGDELAVDLPTMSLPSLGVQPIQIDEVQKTKEVAAIAETDSFKALLDKARKLRKDRSD
jgi:predicted component of type VI protein secretion system